MEKERMVLDLFKKDILPDQDCKVDQLQSQKIKE
ncbi:hypothetical protein QF023_002217 [Chryseobacterium sp. SLBN-27]|jgi:hypothetical protein|nr:hypothetical protein [Chryseobacterium sp. SLBN-27]